VAKLNIGTSGWHYEHWRGPFYPDHLDPSEMLSHYRRQFSTVEINNSFYRLPSEETLADWRRTVPTDLKHTQADMISRRFPVGPAPFRPENDREKTFSATSTTTLKAMLCAMPWS